MLFFSSLSPIKTIRAFSTTPSTNPLNIVIISGSTRTKGPPNPILGTRINKYFLNYLQKRGHSIELIDPKVCGISDTLQKPHFAYAKSQIPTPLEEIHQILTKADAYLCITPEYNHAPSPALLNILNHFGSSTFSFKPSAICSYSAGQWGGTRAASVLRGILSECGCIPVSAMIHVPKAQNVFDEDGLLLGEEQKWDGYFSRCISQLEWWGNASKEYKEKGVDPMIASPAFLTNPSQRNAPSDK